MKCRESTHHTGSGIRGELLGEFTVAQYSKAVAQGRQQPCSSAKASESLQALGAGVFAVRATTDMPCRGRDVRRDVLAAVVHWRDGEADVQRIPVPYVSEACFLFPFPVSLAAWSPPPTRQREAAMEIISEDSSRDAKL